MKKLGDLFELWKKYAIMILNFPQDSGTIGNW